MEQNPYFHKLGVAYFKLRPDCSTVNSWLNSRLSDNNVSVAMCRHDVKQKTINICTFNYLQAYQS